MKKYTYILFDLDGTVTDSEEGIINSIKYCLSYYGINSPDPSFIKKFIGPPLVQSLIEHYAFESKEAERAVEIYNEYFSKKGIFENRLFPGIYQLLETLHQNRKIIILATSQPSYLAKKITKHFNIHKYFTNIVGSNKDGTRMEKKEILQHILDLYPEVPREKFIMIGDRKHDIHGAKYHDIDSVWVNHGYGDDEEKKLSIPSYIVDNVEDLYNLLL